MFELCLLDHCPIVPLLWLSNGPLEPQVGLDCALAVTLLSLSFAFFMSLLYIDFQLRYAPAVQFLSNFYFYLNLTPHILRHTFHESHYLLYKTYHRDLEILCYISINSITLKKIIPVFRKVNVLDFVLFILISCKDSEWNTLFIETK